MVFAPAMWCRPERRWSPNGDEVPGSPVAIPRPRGARNVVVDHDGELHVLVHPAYGAAQRRPWHRLRLSAALPVGLATASSNAVAGELLHQLRFDPTRTTDPPEHPKESSNAFRWRNADRSVHAGVKSDERCKQRFSLEVSGLRHPVDGDFPSGVVGVAEPLA
jgi:hypothetical protein